MEAEKNVARERTAVDQKAAQELQTERAAIVKEITPSLYQRYERVRPNRKGIAVAEVVDGRCTACQIVLRLQYFQDLKHGDSFSPARAASGFSTGIRRSPVEGFGDGTRVAMS